MKTLLVRTLEQWRAWLTEHHSSESEVWLIIHKRHAGVASVAYKDARDEALCFGWVDSIVKRLDVKPAAWSDRAWFSDLLRDGLQSLGEER